MVKNARAKETDSIRACDVIFILKNAGSNIAARYSSPSQPRPRLARVIPSWVADR